MPAETKACLLDDHATPESRLALAQKACTLLGTRPGDAATEARVTGQILRELAPMRERHEQELAAAKQVSEAIEAENSQLKKRIAALEAKPMKPSAHEMEVHRLKANLAYELEKSTTAIAENQELKRQIAELKESANTRIVATPWRRRTVS